MKLTLGYYTIEQAGRALDCHPSEIMYFVNEGNVCVSYFSDEREFVITEGRQGLGVVKYLGLIKLQGGIPIHESHCFEGMLNEQVELLDRKGLLSWNNKLPIDPKLYIQESEMNLDGWVPRSFDEVKSMKSITGLPFPEFGSPYLQKIHQADCIETLKEYPDADLPQYEYFWESNLRFEKDDLRITHDDLMTFKRFIEKSNLTAETTSRNEPTLERQRSNELHQLLFRILNDQPERKTKDIWQSLKIEVGRKSKVYDHEEIILAVTSDEIIWESSYQVKQFLKRTSFPVTISKLRKEIGKSATQ